MTDIFAIWREKPSNVVVVTWRLSLGSAESALQSCLPIVNKNRKFQLEIQIVQLLPPESFRKRWKSSDVFVFSRSNRNDREIAVPFVNSRSARFTSAPFPAFHCRFFRMAASAARQCTVCEAILQSTSEFLNHDCAGE